jgi:hypothetical protein
MPDTLTATRQEQIDRYVQLSAADRFLTSLERWFPEGVVKTEITMGQSALDEMNALFESLWPEDDPGDNPEYQEASKAEDILAARFLLYLGTMSKDYLIDEVDDLLPGEPTDA